MRFGIDKELLRIFATAFGIGGVILSVFYLSQYHAQVLSTKAKERSFNQKLSQVNKEIAQIKNEDQFKKNEKLQEEIKNIESTYKKSVESYEAILKLRDEGVKTQDLDEQFAKVLSLLSERNWTSASAQLADLNSAVSKKQSDLASSFKIPQNVPVKNTAPGAGYSRQSVQSEVGTFLVDVVAADLNSTRVIVDTASDGDCRDNCPVLSLADFAGRSGAFAAINGPYFCPASYPSCAGKTNSFDTLLMNKNKVYFNSDNNVYSTVPAVIFAGSSVRYVGRSSEWGRDTGVDAVIANQPLLVINGNVVFGGDEEVKRSSKGNRSFIGNSGSIVYIGVVWNANVAEAARVIKAMGIQNALNLDDGGSTAMISGGRYVAGPGRNLPFGILLVGR